MDEIEFEMLKPEPGDIIVGRYRMYTLTGNNLWHIFQSMRNTFPDNKVLLIPDDISISKTDKGKLLKIAEQIMAVVKKMKRNFHHNGGVKNRSFCSETAERIALPPFDSH